MKVLVACEESQRVCTAFRLRGHEAFSCDIQDCSGGHPEWHIKGDVLDFIYDDWDMIVAFPPCTYLTNAASSRLFFKKDGKTLINAGRFIKGLDAAAFFKKILNAPCPKIAVENPTPCKIFQLPDPDAIIQPFEFGDPYRKRTCLWLKNLPPLMCTDIVLPVSSWVNTVRSAKIRSRTFPGIASAMAQQWG